jgi:hypothetical protein
VGRVRTVRHKCLTFGLKLREVFPKQDAEIRFIESMMCDVPQEDLTK